MKKVVITRKEFIMTKTLLLSLMLMIVIGCNRASNNKNDFACFEDKKVFVKYSNTIEGYDVKIMVSLDTLHTPRPYRALIDFSKNGETVVQILHPDFFLPEEKRSQYEENSIIIANYNTPTIEEKGIVRLEAFDDVPFFFLDVDFDGKKELLLNHFGMGQRGENAFEVIDFEANDYYGNLEYRKEPFASFDSLTEIDYDNKTITNTGIISGGCEWWISKFRKTDVGFAETIEQHEIQYDKNSVGVEMMRIVTPDSLKSNWSIAPPDKRILR